MCRAASFCEIMESYFRARDGEAAKSLLSELVNRCTHLSTRGLSMFARSHVAAGGVAVAVRIFERQEL